MKHTLLLLILLVCGTALGQDVNPYKFTSMVDLYEFPTVGATGNLDAQLPLYTIKTRNFELPLTLTYDQMGNTNAFYKGSQFGDAWVLNTVGTISRKTMFQTGTYSQGTAYQVAANDPNVIMGGPYRTETIQEAPFVCDELFFIQPGNGLKTHRTTPDVYTFSFMGLTGKFLIYNDVFSGYKANIIESSDFVKIEIDKPQAGQNIQAIYMYDAKGNKYKFGSPSNINQNEYSRTTWLAETVYLTAGCIFTTELNSAPGLIPGGGQSTVINAGHIISKQIFSDGFPFWENMEVTDVYDKDNNHLLNFEYEEVSVQMPDRENIWVNGLGMFKSYKKLYLKKINVINQGTIQFNNTIATINKESLISSYTNSIEIKNLKQETVQKFDLGYFTPAAVGFNYMFPANEVSSGVMFKKRLLNLVKRTDNSAQKQESTQLEYKAPAISLTGQNTLIDRYGFLTGLNYCKDHSKLSSYKADSHILQKIKYPTGGSVVYKFEPNTFSKGSLITDFKNYNHDNLSYQTVPVSTSTTNPKAFIFKANPGDTIAILNKFTEPLVFYKGKEVYTSGNMLKSVTRASIGTYSYADENHCMHYFTNIVIPPDAGTTDFTIRYSAGSPSQSSFKVYKYSHNSQIKNFRYAEGNRISKIAYFKDNVVKTVLDTPAGEASAEKVITFDYSGTQLPNSSSGRVRMSYSSDHQMKPFTVLYDQYVTYLKETGKQETLYNFNLTNWPEAIRTDVKQSKTYDKAGNLLSENNYDYSYGTKLISNPNYTANDIKPFIISTTTSSKNYEGSAFQNSSALSVFDAANQQLTSFTATDALNKVVKTEYDYAQKGNALVNTDTRSYVNATMKEQVRNTYDATGNLMKTEFKTPDMSAYEKIGQENTKYISGLLVGYTQADGTPVTLAYGYNGTQVIAKIVNLDAAVFYSSAYQSLLTNLDNYSNPYHSSYSEANLKLALNGMRTTFANAQITSYTYKPMVGVSSITDANSKTTTYEYDSFSRLATVKDYLGNILKEYQYNFTN